MIRVLMMMACWVTAVLCMAQKKEISQAQTYIKSGKDFDKAEALMTGLLSKDTLNRQNKKIYEVWYQSVAKQYEAANEKLYLRQQYDTAQFFNLVRRFYQVGEALDSIDARPDKKGRVRPEHRRQHAAELDLLRRNLYYGGTYQTRKGNYRQAFDFFDTYIDADRQPLFTGYDYERHDTLMARAAYWATFCGYKMQQADMILRYGELALRDTAYREYTLQYLCEAYKLQHNDTAYVATLQTGYDEFAEHPYFFPRLADYYTTAGNHEKVLALAVRGLSVNADNELFLLAKSVAELNLEQYEACVATSERLIALNDTMPEAYYNIATVRLNQALKLESGVRSQESGVRSQESGVRSQESGDRRRENRVQLTRLYRDARPYMEAYRKLAPEQKGRWAPALYRIYLNLNMGKQFEEIDRVMQSIK